MKGSSSGKKKTKPAPLTDTVALDAITAPDVEPEDAERAALAMAGRAVEQCDCMDPEFEFVSHKEWCRSLCGLTDILDALAIREMTSDHRISKKKVL